jgi:phosphate-selective porin OprO/OprP
MRNRSICHLASVLTTLVLLTAFVPRLTAAEGDELKLLRDQIRALEQKLLVLERKQEIKDEAAAAAAPTTPKITASDKGFTVASPDGANALKIRGLVQLDSRIFFNDGGVVNRTFALRRARLIFEGTFAKNYSFQLVPEFGGGSATAATTPGILDANIGIKVSPQLQFKLGKFKVPVGLELLQSDSWTFFNERSVATLLVPNRDLGVQVSGDVFNNTLNYTVGVFNGVADAASSTNADFDNDKDLVGRLYATPFKNNAGSLLQGLSIGLAGSTGREKTSSGRAASYRTDGQQAFFSYLASTIADGQSWRVSPQLDYRNGSFGLQSEYVISTVNVRPSATGKKTELQNKAWQLSLGYVLTGEDSSYAGVVPATNFDLSAGTWGAFEVVARTANLKIDDKTFPAFASAASNANEVRTFGLGFNWYLTKTVTFKIDYYRARFGFNATAPATSSALILRQDENAFISRFQLSF